MRPLFAGLSAEKAQTYGLVLTASGIAHQISRKGSVWSIAVWTPRRGSAVKAISLYLKENPARSDRGRTLFHMGCRTYSAGYIAAVLALLHLLIAGGHDRQLFVTVFGADAGRILDGDIHRCVTALFLHADIQHLVGNLAGLILFGSVAAWLCGFGLGWLMVLIAGFTGNLLTALWYQHDHIAIGASTAVFGAVGICVALNLRIRSLKKGENPQSARRKWLPLAAGLALLGFLGTSPRADLMAHLSGFGAGLIIGGIGGLWAGRPLCQTPLRVQWGAAFLALGIIAAGWLRGLLYNG